MTDEIEVFVCDEGWEITINGKVAMSTGGEMYTIERAQTEVDEWVTFLTSSVCAVCGKSFSPSEFLREATYVGAEPGSEDVAHKACLS
jgi:hypothetical protein